MQLFLTVMLAGLIWSIGYETGRSSFVPFFAQYLLAFGLFYIIWLNRAEFRFRHYLLIAIALRLILLLAVPQLSNDFYRFIWDGEIMTMGINPYAHTPDYLMSHGSFMADPYLSEMYLGMGDLSQHHYSCYPVLNQLIFFSVAWSSNSLATNVVLLKTILLLADLGAIYYGKKLLEKLNKSTHMIWLYALNPFIILEFSGNVHFEGVMIFFLLAGMYFLIKNNWLTAGIFFGLAIQVKLLPLMLLPFVLKKLKWLNALGFLSTVVFTVLLVGMIILDKHYAINMWNSIRDYFVAFEFNASVYYLFREIDYARLGWNNIAVIGPVMSLVATAGILLLALFRKYRDDNDLFAGMMFALVIYYAFATTVHPWYISMVLIFSVFTSYKFGLIWSLLVMLSYSAYSNGDFHENPLFLWSEYIIVFAVMLIEIFRRTGKDVVGLQLKSFFTLGRQGTTKG